MYFKNEQNWQKQAIKDIAKKYGIDIRVVRQIVYYPFLFAKAKQKDPTDLRPIRFRRLGVFLLKARWKRRFSELMENQ